ncbi:hypothetical protein YC2023_051020 [Brassica napus]
MVRSGCSDPPLESSLAELNSSSSYHISSLTLPFKLETEYRECPSLKSFQTGSASLPTAALKPTDLPLPSASMPSGHRSPQDLGDDLALCVSMNQERITSYSCALDNWPYTQAPTLHCFTMDQVFLSVTD